MKKISIIIPVYNTEQYLVECIESIIKQNYDDYEIILVNDGSKDNSGLICDSYAKQYKNIKVIHKNNGGLSDARNEGLKLAKGEYVLFIDSDDYIYPNSLKKISKILNESNEVDLVFLEALKFYPNGKIETLNNGLKRENISLKSHEEVLQFLCSLSKFPASAWSKIVKRELIIKNNLYFEKDLISEDVDWTLNLLIYAEKFDYCGDNYYCYRQNRLDSITNNLGIKSFNSLYYIIDKWCKSLDEDTWYTNYFLIYLSYEYMMLLTIYAYLNKKERKMVKNNLIRYVWLLTKSTNKKVRLTNIAIRLLGINLTSKLLKMYLILR